MAKKKSWFRRFFADLANLVRKKRGTMNTPGSRILGHVETVFMDHSVFRALYLNRHRVSERMWRSAQLSPAQVRRVADQGIRTILNLRGRRDCASYLMEVEACRRYGVTMIDFSAYSREAPEKEVLRGAAELFKRIEYPALMHCKSGADRAGLMSALFLLIHEGRPVEEAQRQLSWRYGHFRSARTGVLDFFFEEYAAAQAATGIAFFDWVETVYDPKRTEERFKSRAWADTVVDRVLDRE